MIAYPERAALIGAALAAFCAGDALGRSRASTLDGTDELLLAARVLGAGDDEVERRVREAAPAGRGLDAVNGAALRAPAAGWAVPRRDARGRRKLALRLARPTHAGPGPLGAACVVAAMAAAGIESRDAVAAAEREARAGPVAALAPVLAACAGTWEPRLDGAPPDAVQTVAAVVHVVAGAPSSLDAALADAVRHGGDTAAVAALVGAVVGPRFAGEDLPRRLVEVRREPADELDELAAALAARHPR